MTASTHTTAPADSGTYHYWEVSGDHGSVSLHLLHSRHAGVTDIAAMGPRFAKLVSATDGGHWVFDVIQSHRPQLPPFGWMCSTHGGDCAMDAFVSSVAEPIWQRLRDGGVTDARVYAELEALYALEFEQAAA